MIRIDTASCRTGSQPSEQAKRSQAAPGGYIFPALAPRSIVVGTDGSHTAAVAVREAIDLAKGFGAHLHVVSAYHPLSGIRVTGEGADLERAAADASPTVQVDAILENAAGSAHAAGVQADCYARKGEPAEAILDVAAEQGADLIVVGNQGMQSARRFLLGSVPDKISHHAPCSVLIVRTT